MAQPWYQWVRHQFTQFAPIATRKLTPVSSRHPVRRPGSREYCSSSADVGWDAVSSRAAWRNAWRRNTFVPTAKPLRMLVGMLFHPVLPGEMHGEGTLLSQLQSLFGRWLGCCFIPCCLEKCMEKEHFCPNCKASSD